MRFMNISLPLFFYMLISGCSTSTPYTKTVSNVDLQRFMIPWHVQAGRFTSFEKDPYNSIESYTWNEKEQRIDIDFSYNQGGFNGPVKKIPQKGWVKDTKTNATWEVQPWWPLKFDYLIIALADDYEWTVIGVPNQNYLWVMSKDPHFPREKVDQIIRDIAKTGYSIENIQYVQHK